MWAFEVSIVPYWKCLNFASYGAAAISSKLLNCHIFATLHYFYRSHMATKEMSTFLVGHCGNLKIPWELNETKWITNTIFNTDNGYKSAFTLQGREVTEAGNYIKMVSPLL